MLSQGWKKVDALKEKDYNEVVFALESSAGEIAILNSGSDQKRIIKEFGDFLDSHREAIQIFTAIHPKEDVDPRPYEWMMEKLNIQDDDNVERIEL